MELNFRKVKETKSCHVYQHGKRGGDDYVTLYLKKAMIAEAGIDADAGVTITVKEAAK